MIFNFFSWYCYNSKWQRDGSLFWCSPNLTSPIIAGCSNKTIDDASFPNLVYALHLEEATSIVLFLFFFGMRCTCNAILLHMGLQSFQVCSTTMKSLTFAGKPWKKCRGSMTLTRRFLRRNIGINTGLCGKTNVSNGVCLGGIRRGTNAITLTCANVLQRCWNFKRVIRRSLVDHQDRC